MCVEITRLISSGVKAPDAKFWDHLEGEKPIHLRDFLNSLSGEPSKTFQNSSHAPISHQDRESLVSQEPRPILIEQE